MGSHEVVRKEHYRASSQSEDDDGEAGLAGGAEVFEPGDEINPTEAELQAYPDRFRELRGSAEGSVDVPLDLGDMTVSEVEEALESGDYDDSLDILAQAESQGDDRTGVHEAIDERRE